MAYVLIPHSSNMTTLNYMQLNDYYLYIELALRIP